MILSSIKFSDREQFECSNMIVPGIEESPVADRQEGAILIWYGLCLQEAVWTGRMQLDLGWLAVPDSWERRALCQHRDETPQ